MLRNYSKFQAKIVFLWWNWGYFGGIRGILVEFGVFWWDLGYFGGIWGILVGFGGIHPNWHVYTYPGIAFIIKHLLLADV